VELYPGAEEEIPKNLPGTKGSRLRMTIYEDSDHAHDLVVRRSITEIIVMQKITPNKCISKHQKIVQTSTYCSELVVPRIAA
jgi:hypothetical protein